MPSVTIRVPGTTANLGPGFDTLGIAVKLYNRVRVAPAGKSGICITSPIADESRAGAEAMLGEAAALFFKRTRKAKFGFDISLTGDVPIARGLGSSVTARLGLVAALNELTKAKLDRQALLELVTELEGHPDNAAPAIFGGFTAAGMVGDSVRVVRCEVSPRLKFVTLIPRFEVSTAEARKLVPQSFSKSDAVHNLNRAALIGAAFALADYESLEGCFDDRVHQPYRERLIPQLGAVIRAGEKAGAIGGWLSGSGSTIMCMTMVKAEAVAAAMRRQLKDSDVHILAADNGGVRVLDASA